MANDVRADAFRAGAATGKVMRVAATAADNRASEVLKALASDTRLAILRCVADRAATVNEIAQALHLPASTANRQVAILERAGLLATEMRPASRGLQKVCARTYDELVMEFPPGARPTRTGIEVAVPIGSYSDFQVEPTCGLASTTGLIGFVDDPNTFYEPDRQRAQLIWFRSGHLEYRLPNRLPPTAAVQVLELSAEVCSEAPQHDPAWPSDISVWINGVHLGAWTCVGDFGGQRGYLTPVWWPDRDSQFGVLKRWKVTPLGTTIDGMPLSTVTLEDIRLRPGAPITVRIGVASDAVHVGGANLFGRGFGNYPQDIELRIEFESPVTRNGRRP